jgi:hypothetical protein
MPSCSKQNANNINKDPKILIVYINKNCTGL